MVDGWGNDRREEPPSSFRSEEIKVSIGRDAGFIACRTTADDAPVCGQRMDAAFPASQPLNHDEDLRKKCEIDLARKPAFDNCKDSH